TKTGGSSYQTVAIYDGPPPLSGTIGTTQIFDAAKPVTVAPNAPDTSCSAYSYDPDKSDATPHHLYWFCANARSFAQAETNCQTPGGHLARMAGALENGLVSANRTTTPAWIGGKDTGTNRWSWVDNNDQFWNGGATGSAVGGRYAGWRSGQPAASGLCVT